MQPASHQKKKYVMEDYISASKANPIIKKFNKEKSVLVCVCENKDQIGLTCFKCSTFVHNCLAVKPNRGQKYECCSCLNKVLDPLFQVRKILVESFFRSVSIFEYVNIVNFQFTLDSEDLRYPVQVRGLFPDNTTLNWPMQGAFYINDEKSSICELKPLLYNSNRKHRRQEYFSVPSDKLKIGKNYIRFKIPCLDKQKFTSKYQHQEKKVYYMAVNSVQRLTPGDLETQTFRERRVEKEQSLKILKSNNAEIQVIQNKVCLVCPYTRQRIKVPIRGRYCKHFSCICLQTLIGTHSASRHWGCPICQLKINEPYVDLWIYKMLKDNQQGSEVNVKEDGTYEWIKVQNKAMMSLDSDDDDDSSPPFVPPKPQPKAVTEKKQPSKEEIVKKPPSVPNPTQINNKASNIISLDDDQQDIRQKRKEEAKKQLIKKAKQSIKQTKFDSQQSKPQIEAKKSKQAKQIQENKKKQERSIPKPRMVGGLNEVKTLECKQMKHDQFKKAFYKSKVNPFRKYIQNEEFKRIFKEII